MESLSAKKSKRMLVDFTNPNPKCPREIFLDLNNNCNCKCFFCGNTKIAGYAYLDKALAFRVMKEFYDMGTREIALYATGEPFLRNDLAEFVSKAKKIGYEYVFITSNGILATPERAKAVLDAGLDSIKFSVNAGTRESYKKVHGVDQFEAVVRNIKWFHEYRKESGLRYKIYASMVPTHITKDEGKALAGAIGAFVDELDYRGCSNQGGNMIENNMTEQIDAKNLLGSLRKGQFTGKCPDIFSRCVVTPEGYLSACCVDYQNYLVTADLNTTSAKDAWNNEVYVALRKRHISGDLETLICYNCINNQSGETVPLTKRHAKPFTKKGRIPA